MVLRHSARVVAGSLLGASAALAEAPAPPPTSPPSTAPAPVTTSTPAAAPATPPSAVLPETSAPPAAAEPPAAPAPGPAPAPLATSTTDPPPPATRPEAGRPPGPPPFARHGGPRRGPRPWFGGIGYGSIAPFFGDIGGLESMLAGPAALGASYAPPNSALLMGGGGGAVLFGHLWVGGKGYGLLTGGFENALGSVSMGGGGGGFELGYVAVPAPRTLVIPYFGAGGFHAWLEVENETSRNLVDGTRSLPQNESGVRVIAPPGGTRSFDASLVTLDAGIRVMRLFSPRGGGMLAGFELGFSSSFTQPAWETEGYEVTNAESAGLEGVYIRLVLGGGGFAFR